MTTDQTDQTTPARDWVGQLHDAGNDPDTLRRSYDAEADAYAEAVRVNRYRAYDIVAQIAAKAASDAGLVPSRVRVLDAASGTGLVGAELAAYGFSRIDGCDLSPAMTAYARRTGAYSELHVPCNLNVPWPVGVLPGDYNLVTCAGAFTPGHLIPRALSTLIQAARSGGLIVVSAQLQWVREVRFETHAAELIRTGVLEEVSRQVGPYVDARGGDVNAREMGLYPVYRVARRAFQHTRTARTDTGRANGHRH